MSFLTTADFIDQIMQMPASYTNEQGRIKALRYLSELIDQYELRPKVPVFAVTGTNGKGSTAHIISKILMQHGKKVGTFTSPHLLHIGERISVNLHATSESDFLALANVWYKKICTKNLGYYDFLLLLALAAFKNCCVDAMVLEVGIGGRLDALSALDADVVILTSIALDHMHILGNTREAIGREKIALLRQGKILICGDKDPPESIKQHVAAVTADSYWINEHFGFIERDYWLPNSMLNSLPASLLKQENISCALMAITAFFGKDFLKISALSEALNRLHLPGRCQQIFFQNFEIILDVAHNPAATDHLATYVASQPAKPCYAVVGMMKDKDIAASLRSLLPYVDVWYCCEIDEKRGAKAEELKKILQEHGVDENNIHCCASIVEAWSKLGNTVTTECRIIFFGSFRVVEPMLKVIHANV